MCGIAGFVGAGEFGDLVKMTNAIRHRGPDAEGFWHDPRAGVFLGHRRLSIVDLAGGAQPMWTTDSQLGVTFNGEIYNHADLRAELRALGHEFETDHSDTEVLLHGYRAWGDGFVERLNGMWAFVIYDKARRRIFASRDRFGKKPFYYFHEKDALGFASELTALTQHPSCPRSISPLSLQKYFAYCYIPAPRSIYERVWKLPGGHSLSYDVPAGELKTWRYWEFVLEPPANPLSPPVDTAMILPNSPKIARDHWNGLDVEKLCHDLRSTLEKAVQRRLMSDVPLGVFLSGGIDSSAIAALAAKHVPEGQLNTFAIGFSEPSFDESRYARTVAETLGTRHRQEILDLDKSRALLPDLVSHLDEPLGDSSLLPTYLLSRFTRQHVTVALGGDGGDELFAGYDPFRALGKAEFYARAIPKPIHAGIRFLAARLPVSHANISFDFKIKRTLMGLSYGPELWNAVWMGALEPRELSQLGTGADGSIEEVYSEAIEAWDRCRQPNPVDRALQFWTNLYLQDGILAKVDRASMLCSLEARTPFLDIDFVNLARRIPWQLKLHRGQTKWILKKALAPLLPRQIVRRKKKGFGMPIGRWMREGKFDFDHTPARPHLETAFAGRKILAHMENKSDERLFLWSYWLLARWLSRS
ncbi:MAG: asparagine synthase (glutamine-hydrolyzing) [Chthoniobacteraceae bacterium]